MFSFCCASGGHKHKLAGLIRLTVALFHYMCTKWTWLISGKPFNNTTVLGSSHTVTTLHHREYRGADDPLVRRRRREWDPVYKYATTTTETTSRIMKPAMPLDEGYNTMMTTMEWVH